ncbi:MAG: CBS domain-containing protein [bacterium]
MTVARWMTRNPITIEEDAPVFLAFHLLLTNDIRHLPVLSGGKPVGIITDRDLKEALVSSDPGRSNPGSPPSYHRIKEVRAKKIMTPNPIMIGPAAPIEEAAQILLERKISCLPVKGPDGALVGILTVTDVLKAFIEFMAVLGGSQRIDIVMDSSDYDRVCLLLQNQGATVISVGITAENDLGRKIYSFRLKDADAGKVTELLRREGCSVLPF